MADVRLMLLVSLSLNLLFLVWALSESVARHRLQQQMYALRYALKSLNQSDQDVAERPGGWFLVMVLVVAVLALWLTL